MKEIRLKNSIGAKSRVKPDPGPDPEEKRYEVPFTVSERTQAASGLNGNFVHSIFSFWPTLRFWETDYYNRSDSLDVSITAIFPRLGYHYPPGGSITVWLVLLLVLRLLSAICMSCPMSKGF